MYQYGDCHLHAPRCRELKTCTPQLVVLYILMEQPAAKLWVVVCFVMPCCHREIAVISFQL